MEFGGIIIIATVVTLLGLIPLLAARQKAKTFSRESDRFSTGMKLLNNNESNRQTCGRSTGQLLGVRRTITQRATIAMADQAAMNAKIRIEHRANKAVREIAKLRARRAARLAAEAAAGRRRLGVSATCAGLSGLVAIVCAALSASFLWTLIPAALLVMSLVASRMAAIRSDKANEAELELLENLRNAASARGVRKEESAPAPKTQKDDLFAGITADRSTSRATVSPASQALEKVELDASASTSLAESGDTNVIEMPNASADAVSGETQTDLVNAEDEAEELALTGTAVERRTWTVNPIPAPRYATRGRVSGRSVHIDTDIRGIPKVGVAVPARPIAATVAENAMTTEQVVADQAVALDLDAVLDARRAQ